MCHFALPWVNFNDFWKYSMTRSMHGLSATAELIVRVWELKLDIVQVLIRNSNEFPCPKVFLLPQCCNQNFVFSQKCHDFYRTTHMHSADHALAICLYVRLFVYLSVCHTPVFCRRRWTYPQVFLPSHSPAILVFCFPTPNRNLLWKVNC